MMRFRNLWKALPVLFVGAWVAGVPLLPSLGVGAHGAPAADVASPCRAHGRAGSCKVVTLLGDDRREPVRGLAARGRAEAFPFVATGSGTTASASLYVTRGTNARMVKLGLYSSVRGRPGSLLGSGSKMRPRAGRWVTVAFGRTAIRAGKRYWLAILGTGGAISFLHRAGGRCLGAVSAHGGLSRLPRTWASGRGRLRCPISAYVRGPARSRRPGLAPVPTSGATLACTRTLRSGQGDVIQQALQNAPPGAVLCVPAGSYDPTGEVDIANINPSGRVVLQPTAGASVTLGWLNINAMSNVTVKGFNLAGGVSLTNGAANDAFQDNIIDGVAGADSGFYFYGNGNQQTNISMIHNTMSHLAPADLGPPGAGQCVTIAGGSGTEHNFTVSNNTCGPGIAGHYTQVGGIDGLTEDGNTFLGPASPESVTKNAHNNVLQIFGDGANIDFSNNVMRRTDSRGQTLLFQEGSFTNVKINNNLDVEDPACLQNSDCYSYAYGLCSAQGLQFTNNTVIDSYWGSLLTHSESDSVGNCTTSGSNYNISHNIFVTPDGKAGNAAISYAECRTNCTFDYNVTDDGSARQGGSTHSVPFWKPRWVDTVSYQPRRLPFAAGYTP